MARLLPLTICSLAFFGSDCLDCSKERCVHCHDTVNWSKVQANLLSILNVEPLHAEWEDQVGHDLHAYISKHKETFLKASVTPGYVCGDYAVAAQMALRLVDGQVQDFAYVNWRRQVHVVAALLRSETSMRTSGWLAIFIGLQILACEAVIPSDGFIEQDNLPVMAMLAQYYAWKSVKLSGNQSSLLQPPPLPTNFSTDHKLPPPLHAEGFEAAAAFQNFVQFTKRAPLLSVSSCLFAASSCLLLALESDSAWQTVSYLNEAAGFFLQGVNLLENFNFIRSARGVVHIFWRLLLLAGNFFEGRQLSPHFRESLEEEGSFPRHVRVLLQYNTLYTYSALCDEARISWWLTHGSLLGALRNGGIIPHDEDVDIAMWMSDLPKLHSPTFRHNLMRNGLFLKFNSQLHILVGEITSGTILLDVWAYDVDTVTGKVSIVTAPGYKGHERLNIKMQQLFPHKKEMRRVLFGELEVNVPSGATLLLTQLYGSDWRSQVRTKANKSAAFIAASTDGTVAGPMAGPTGPLNRLVKLDISSWQLGSAPRAVFRRGVISK